jgi:histone demethylase JARID1
MSSLSTSLKNSYQKWLCPYEDYLRIAKPGVHQQLELEYGGPLTPSPAPSPLKRSNVHTPPSLRAESPARHATDALQASIDGQTKDSDRDVSMSDAPAFNTPQATSGFTAINSGGFTAVNSSFTSVNRALTTASDVKGLATPKQYGTPLSSTKNTPEYRPSSLGPAGLKRQMSCESLDSAKKDSTVDKDEGDSGSRRSKRLKKGGILLYVFFSPQSLPPVLLMSLVLIQTARRHCTDCGGLTYVALSFGGPQDIPGRGFSRWRGMLTAPSLIHNWSY